MARALKWERQDGGTYTWVLGLHYYAEKTEDGTWPVACMVGNDDIWEGGVFTTRPQAEAAAQAHFNEQVEQHT